MSEDYEQTVEFKSLTQQQQKWWIHYYEHRDVFSATLHAYATVPENAKSYGNSVAAGKNMSVLIDRYCRVKTLPSVEDLRAMYIKIFEEPNEHSRVRLQALTAYERVSGFSKPPKAKEDDTFSPMDDILG